MIIIPKIDYFALKWKRFCLKIYFVTNPIILRIVIFLFVIKNIPYVGINTCFGAESSSKFIFIGGAVQSCYFTGCSQY